MIQLVATTVNQELRKLTQNFKYNLTLNILIRLVLQRREINFNHRQSLTRLRITNPKAHIISSLYRLQTSFLLQLTVILYVKNISLVIFH